MAYTPTNWQTGEVIAAEKLNKLENGVADFVITITTGFGSEPTTCDVTYAEFMNAYSKNSRVWLHLVAVDENNYTYDMVFPTQIREVELDGSETITARYKGLIYSNTGTNNDNIAWDEFIDIDIGADVYDGSYEPTDTLGCFAYLTKLRLQVVE